MVVDMSPLWGSDAGSTHAEEADVECRDERETDGDGNAASETDDAWIRPEDMIEIERRYAGTATGTRVHFLTSYI